MTDSLYKTLGFDTVDREGIEPKIDGDSIIVLDQSQNPPVEVTLTDFLNGLQSALAIKADLNQPNGVVVDEQLPNLAQDEYFEVANEAQQLALNARPGDHAERLDQGGIIYLLKRDNANVLANWQIIHDPNAGGGTPVGNSQDEQFTPAVGQVVFNLSQVPLNILSVTVNGDTLSEGGEYTNAGAVLTLNLPYALAPDDFVRVIYTA